MKQLYTTIQNLFKQEDTISEFNTLNLKVPDFIDLYDRQPETPEEFEFTTRTLVQPGAKYTAWHSNNPSISLPM